MVNYRVHTAGLIGGRNTGTDFCVVLVGFGNLNGIDGFEYA